MMGNKSNAKTRDLPLPIVRIPERIEGIARDNPPNHKVSIYDYMMISMITM